MKKYQIDVFFHGQDSFQVTAETEDEARKIAEKMFASAAAQFVNCDIEEFLISERKEGAENDGK